MGLLDQILGNVVGAALGSGQPSRSANPLEAILAGLAGGGQRQGQGPAQGATLLAAVLALVQQAGGLGAVLDMFRQKGMAPQADSWVSTGANMNITGTQVQDVFGASALGNLAAQLGMSQGQAGSAMAQILPELINQFTPQAQVPENDNDLLSQALQMLRR